VDGRWRLVGAEVPLPGPVLDLLVGRLERLGAAALRVLGVAAVAGAEVGYPLLRAVSEDPESAVLDALDACLAKRALEETAAGYRFDHPLRRMAVYERLSRARRTSLHGRIAAALEALHAGRLDDQAETLAHHWALSEQPGRAVPHLVRAGDRAAALHANEAAGAAYRRALELLAAPGEPEDRPPLVAELWEKIGDLRALAGETPADTDAYRAALDALRSAPAIEPALLTRLHRKAAYAALARHDPDAAAPHLAAAETTLRDLPDTAEWGRLRLMRALEAWARGRHDEGRRAAEESLALARQRGEGLDLLNAYMTLALVFHSSGAWKEGLQIEIEHMGLAADTDPGLALLFDAHICLGEYHLYGDMSFEAVEAYAGRALDLATRAGARRAQALAWLLRGEALLLRGRWPEAAHCLERSLELQRAVGATAGQVLALQRLAELHAYCGDHAAAQGHLERALGVAVDPPMAPHVWARVYATAAANALGRGDPGAAIRAIDEAAEVAGRTGTCGTCSAVLHPIAAEASLALGDLDRAEQHARAAEQAAANWESGTWRAMAEIARAEVERARGDAAAASRRYLAAAAEFERVGQPFDAARALLGAARAAADRGDAQGARALAGRALATFEDLGAQSTAAQAQALLRRL
jgi:tetratricopeptide (TPR) repeat protein